MKKTNQELIDMARERARKAGKPMPATAADVERLTGFIYNGPDPQAVGKTYSVTIQRLR